MSSSSCCCLVVKRVFFTSTRGFWMPCWGSDSWKKHSAFRPLCGLDMTSPSKGQPASSAFIWALSFVLCLFSESSIHHCRARCAALSRSKIFSKEALSSEVKTRWKSSRRTRDKSTTTSFPEVVRNATFLSTCSLSAVMVLSASSSRSHARKRSAAALPTRSPSRVAEPPPSWAGLGNGVGHGVPAGVLMGVGRDMLASSHLNRWAKFLSPSRNASSKPLWTRSCGKSGKKSRSINDDTASA
mmetsp:Transcript_17282/g.49446  ORF Transcript_17282/g.49446 Transcript_17282/m.49446 type:complete len:242 (-) Transcript_17282:174-899(-)